MTQFIILCSFQIIGMLFVIYFCRVSNFRICSYARLNLRKHYIRFILWMRHLKKVILKVLWDIQGIIHNEISTIMKQSFLISIAINFIVVKKKMFCTTNESLPYSTERESSITIMPVLTQLIRQKILRSSGEKKILHPPRSRDLTPSAYHSF